MSGKDVDFLVIAYRSFQTDWRYNLPVYRAIISSFTLSSPLIHRSLHDIVNVKIYLVEGIFT